MPAETLAVDGSVIWLVTIGLALGGPVVVWITTVVCRSWERVAKHREEVDLKHRMLEEGFSAEEIALVLNTGDRKSDVKKIARLRKKMIKQRSRKKYRDQSERRRPELTLSRANRLAR